MDFGVILDLETTGLDPKQDQIIELAVLEFGVEEGQRPSVVRSYGSLQDPGIPLSADVTRITGLTDQMVKGQAIDWAIVTGILARASIVIAHNAEFDRGFLRASGKLAGLKLHWGCSLRHIDWKKHGFGSGALTYLAADHGFVNPFPHRALFDCATTFKLMAPHLDELIERSYEREFLVRAVGSPFESKDALKARGYRWDAEARVWTKVVPESALQDERAFLAEKVYLGEPRHAEMEIA